MKEADIEAIVKLPQLRVCKRRIEKTEKKGNHRRQSTFKCRYIVCNENHHKPNANRGKEKLPRISNVSERQKASIKVIDQMKRNRTKKRKGRKIKEKSEVEAFSQKGCIKVQDQEMGINESYPILSPRHPVHF